MSHNDLWGSGFNRTKSGPAHARDLDIVLVPFANRLLEYDN